MKSYKRVFFLFLLLLSFSNNIFSQSLMDQVEGVWVFDFDKSISLMDGKAKKHFDAMESSRKSKIERAYANRKVIFEANGVFVQELSNGRKLEAVWQLVSEEGEDKIKVSDTVGVRWFGIKELKEDVLVITPMKNDRVKANMLMSQWYLTRVTN